MMLTMCLYVEEEGGIYSLHFLLYSDKWHSFYVLS